MLASVVMNKETTIKITTELESKPYVEITADLMITFGCEINGNYSVSVNNGNYGAKVCTPEEIDEIFFNFELTTHKLFRIIYVTRSPTMTCCGKIYLHI